MKVYYERYARNASAGNEGYCFFGNRWPEGVDVDQTSLQGIGYLKNQIMNIYGDNGVSESEPASLFMLRDCLGSAHAIACGVAHVKRDAQGRTGTWADFIVCLPERESEREVEPHTLYDFLSKRCEPGTLQSVVLPVGQAEQKDPQSPAAKMATQLAYGKNSLVFAGVTSDKAMLVLTNQIHTMLPKARQRTFSFMTYTRQLDKVLMVGGLKFIAVPDSPTLPQTIQQWQLQGSDLLLCHQDGTVQQRAFSYESAAEDPALPYLRRIYPQLLQKNMLDKPAECALWLRSSSYGEAAQRLSEPCAEALGLMLQAMAGHTSAFYPKDAEKQAIVAGLYA